MVGGAQGCVPRGANGEMVRTSSRSGILEIMRTIVAVAVQIILREAREGEEGRLNEWGDAAHCVRTVTKMTCEG